MQGQLEDLALFALATAPGFSWAGTRAEIDELGSPSAVLHARFEGQLLGGFDEAVQEAERVIAEHATRGIHTVTLYADDYPRQLRAVHDAPPVLYWQGRIQDRDASAVAIVGTRTPDAWGTGFARDLAGMLADRDVPVISGLARGIDVAAMRASLDRGGRTIGVIGTGLGVYYPREHRALQDEIAAHHLLMSQFAPGSSASKKTFPMRNVVMSGFASATVIVQAGETSGTRTQAAAAVRHGRPVIMTRHVAEKAKWAQDLVAGAYDIIVVADAVGAFDAVQQIQERQRADVDLALGALLSV